MLSLLLVYSALGCAVPLAYLRIDSASVTAFLARADPSGRWLACVNGLVGCAVLLTYPLQMQPALMVLDRPRTANNTN